uniref:T-box domain-containing protein n=1 Tax=Caenorhabditis japonica TaxID=281687 RepID=A0A8R1I4E2_CAEJA
MISNNIYPSSNFDYNIMVPGPSAFNHEGVVYNCQDFPEIQMPMTNIFQLEDKENWNQFVTIYQEMFVCSAGRAIYPDLKFTVHNLNPSSEYQIITQLERINNHPMEWKNNQWVEDPNGSCDGIPKYSNQVVSKPKMGWEWMEEGSFQVGKIFSVGSDNKTGKKRREASEEEMEQMKREKSAKVDAQLKTMLRVVPRQKYTPIIGIQEVKPDGSTEFLTSLRASEVFFITVTAIKNEACAWMRKNNKYCRGDVKEQVIQRFSTAPYTKKAPIKERKMKKSQRSSIVSSSSSSSSSTGTVSPDSTRLSYTSNESLTSSLNTTASTSTSYTSDNNSYHSNQWTPPPPAQWDIGTSYDNTYYGGLNNQWNQWDFSSTGYCPPQFPQGTGALEYPPVFNEMYFGQVVGAGAGEGDAPINDLVFDDILKDLEDSSAGI